MELPEEQKAMAFKLQDTGSDSLPLEATKGGQAVISNRSTVGGLDVVVDAPRGKTWRDMVAAKGMTVFGKSSCPFCTEVERTLNMRIEANGGKWQYIRLDRVPDGAALHSALINDTKQRTVPYVFADGVLIGGCDDMKAAESTGGLAGLLGPWKETGAAAAASQPDWLPGALGLFPNTVDARVVRTTGALVSIASLLIAVLLLANSDLHDSLHSASRWMSVGLFVDFCLRFFAGANASLLGALAVALVGVGERFFGTKATFRSGTPKQFAQLIGVIFSGTAALFFMLSREHGQGLKWAGAAVLLGLAGAAGLEGFGNFCLGCVFFSWGVHFGLFPSTVYSRHINEKPDTAFTWEDWNKRLNEGVPEHKHKLYPGRETQSKVDMAYKVKTDDQRRESFGFVKYFHCMYWMKPLSLTALAFVFYMPSTLKYSDGSSLRIKVPDAVWQTLACVALLNCVVFAVLQTLRVACYTKKVLKELHCPIRGNAFVFPTICVLIFSQMALHSDIDSRALAKVLFWAAAPLQLAISVYVMSGWVHVMHDVEHFSSVWLAVPVSNVFASMAFYAIYGNGVNPVTLTGGGLWLGFAALVFVAVFPVAVYRAIVGAKQNLQDRNSVFMLVAAPAVLGLGLLQSGGAFSVTALALLWEGALALMVVLAHGIYPHRFYLSGPWNMSFWALGFTASALAAGAVAMHAIVGPSSDLTFVLAIIGLAAACFLNANSAAHFVRDVATYKVFVSEKMLGPIMFMKLTHEAFRGLFARLRGACDRLEAFSDAKEPVSAAAGSLMALYEDLEFLTRVHMAHEDNVIFPAADEWLPRHSDPFHEEHEEDLRQREHLAPIMQALNDALSVGSQNKEARVLEAVSEALRPLRAHVEWVDEHLRHEENDLSPLLRKNMPIATMKTTLQKVWEVTAPQDMFRFLPLVINSMQRHPQRIMMLRVLLWSMPNRCKQIGVMLALGVDLNMWHRLTDVCPDIIPRGMAGWRRYG